VSSNAINDIAPNYDARSIRLHWITAALVVALWCLGETVDWFPKGNIRIAARSLHILLGVALGSLLCVRLWWRLGADAIRLAPAGSAIVRALATLVHFALYALWLATAVLGLTNAWVRGDTLFNLITIPAFDPGNRALRGQVEDLHSLSANILIWFAGFHAAMGLAHHFVWKDGVLRRMLPARR